MIGSVSGVMSLGVLLAFWEREAENAVLYLYRKALILASGLMRPTPLHYQGYPPVKGPHPLERQQGPSKKLNGKSKLGIVARYLHSRDGLHDTCD